jgi:hypothetical protein
VAEHHFFFLAGTSAPLHCSMTMQGAMPAFHELAALQVHPDLPISCDLHGEEEQK